VSPLSFLLPAFLSSSTLASQFFGILPSLTLFSTFSVPPFYSASSVPLDPPFLFSVPLLFSQRLLSFLFTSCRIGVFRIIFPQSCVFLGGRGPPFWYSRRRVPSHSMRGDVLFSPKPSPLLFSKAVFCVAEILH